MRFPGGKGKCFQRIINLLPPHHTYIESHLGGGAVLRHKKPASRSIGIDKDPRIIEGWRRRQANLAEFRVGDAVEELRAFPFRGEEVVYADPPYLRETRRGKPLYRFDYTESDHYQLLHLLKSLPCAVVISGYESDLYDSLLTGWSRLEFAAMTHHGIRTEILWFNYPTPRELHDVSYLGMDFREREIVRRRLNRLKRRLARLTPIEQNSIRTFLEEMERGRRANRSVAE